MTNPIAQVRTIPNKDGTTHKRLCFWCPGCEYEVDGVKQGGAHMLPITGSGSTPPTTWEFNGNVESPTLSPSILTDVTYAPRTGETQGRRLVCHSFMRDGKLEFLGDCTHQYANQTIPLPPLPDWLVKEGNNE